MEKLELNIKIAYGEIETPVFITIGTVGSVKNNLGMVNIISTNNFSKHISSISR